MQLDSSTLPRNLSNQLRDRLSQVPAVVLLGPRQVGKTTLARELAVHQGDSILLDLQRPADRAKLTNADLFLQGHRDRLVILDEVQFMPELFAQLRPEIDAHRRPSRFLLLGSASGQLLAQSSESLAGRVSYLELTPFLASELMPAEAPVDLNLMQKLWLRGGFPQSFLSPSAETSYQWRADFIQTFIGRDLRELGVNVPVDTLFRFWRMLAHLHGQQFNASAIGGSLGGVSHKVVATYLATLIDAMMVRKLEPHFVNLGKRLVKSPKIYVRDSGLLHALLGVPDVNALMGHPSAGASWEGFCIEQICGQIPTGATVSYYRTAAGTELDLIVETGRKKVAFEIKFSNAPKVTKGFWQGLEDTGVDQAYIVAPVSEAWRLAANVEVLSPNLAAAVLK